MPPQPPASLPIDAFLPKIIAALRERTSLVLVAEPGAGKTTRVPPALLEAGFAEQGEIIVLQPRRIAARMAARRVSSELGEEVGGRIGYQVRFEDVSSKRTRVRFVTEGVLTRKLVHDPELRGVSVVILDEFHERHLHGDVGLALLRRLSRTTRPDLRIVVMSATLAAEPLARFLDCESVFVPGRPYEVTIEYGEHLIDHAGAARRRDERNEPKLEARVASGFRKLLREGLNGDVLVFLPGAAEIRRAQTACEAIAREADVEITLLHGDLPPRDQDRAIQKSARRKLILSTNVAETSLTIEGVVAVIDSGLARIAGHSAFSGLPTLMTLPISRASAKQRAGRAGRLGPGRCLRLYDKHDHDTRPEHDKPEIERSDLAETLLSVKVSGVTLADDEWLDPPPTAAWQAAHDLLTGLGALHESEITASGRRFARYPLHPRLARLVIEAEQRGVAASGCWLAALLSEREIMQSARTRFGEQRRDLQSGRSDLLHRLELLESVGDHAGAGSLRAHELDAGAVAAVLRVRDRLLSMFGDAFDKHELTEDQRDEALSISLTAAFFDRVAKRRNKNSADLVFASGGSAVQAETSVVRDAEHVVVVDAAERRGASRAVEARLVSAIEPEYLLELFPERIVDRSELVFEAKTERVVSEQTLMFGTLVLDRATRSDVEGEEVSRVLFAAAKTKGVEQFVDREALGLLRERLSFAAQIDPKIPQLGDDAAERALLVACEGRKSFAELREVPMLELLYAQLPGATRTRLYELTPDHIELPHGRRLQVHYERGKPPWIESRLQDFFGMKDGPRLGGKPLTVHLLAPNQRAVQVTSDLAGFWQRHYPEVRRELSRRYPRHSWPDDPASSVPSKPLPRRR